MPQMDEQIFENHRGVTPMLWVFTSIACMELLGVHLFLTLTWPWLAWPMSVLTGTSIIWLVSWIRSWKRLPHRLADGVLTLHMGSLRRVSVPLGQIASIDCSVNDALLKQPGVLRLVPIAYPNRIITLTTPLDDRRKTSRIAIRLDDPAAFDATMVALGIPLRA